VMREQHADMKIAVGEFELQYLAKNS
jgi:hypothetical protein